MIRLPPRSTRTDTPCPYTTRFRSLWFHAHAVWSVPTLSDPVSPGWNTGGGWRFVVAAVPKATMFNLSPVAITPLLVPLSLLGWAAWSGASGLRTFLSLPGFICAMRLFGRPDTFYWAVRIPPLLFVALLFAPAPPLALILSVARPPTPG